MTPEAERPVVKRTPNPPVVYEQGDTLLQVIAAAARDPHVDVAKMSALLELKERVEARDAKAQFNAAFARMQKILPRVTKHGVIDLGKGKIPFAKWEDIDTVIRPILANEGFALSFTAEPSEGRVRMTAHLRHAAGHEETSTMELPPDTGPGRNALQAIGSSHSYGKRYLACDMLNIILEGQDNDGSKAFPLKPEQLEQVENMVAACELKGDALRRFLQYADATSVETIQQHRFDDVMQALKRAHEKKLREGR